MVGYLLGCKWQLLWRHQGGLPYGFHLQALSPQGLHHRLLFWSGNVFTHENRGLELARHQGQNFGRRPAELQQLAAHLAKFFVQRL